MFFGCDAAIHAPLLRQSVAIGVIRSNPRFRGWHATRTILCAHGTFDAAERLVR